MMINVDNRLLEIIKEEYGVEVTFQQVKSANKVRRQERLFQKGTYIRTIKNDMKFFLPGSLCRKLVEADLFDEVTIFARNNPDGVVDYVKSLEL